MWFRRQLVYELRRLRIIAPNCNAFEDPELNRYSNCWPVLQAVIVAGCYPGIGSAKSGNKLRKIRTRFFYCFYWWFNDFKKWLPCFINL